MCPTDDEPIGRRSSCTWSNLHMSRELTTITCLLARPCSIGIAIRYVLPVSRMTPGILGDTKRRILKGDSIGRRQCGFYTVANTQTDSPGGRTGPGRSRISTIACLSTSPQCSCDREVRVPSYTWSYSGCGRLVPRLRPVQVSAVANWPARQNRAVARSSLTICAINYSGRASELGGIIDLVDRRQSSLSWSERLPFSS